MKLEVHQHSAGHASDGANGTFRRAVHVVGTDPGSRLSLGASTKMLKPRLAGEDAIVDAEAFDGVTEAVEFLFESEL
jgi:hypothetical protein